jgi:hypothetical protein
MWGMGDCDTVSKNVSLCGFSNFIGNSKFAAIRYKIVSCCMMRIMF